MKKWIALLLAMTMVLSLAACGGKNTANDTSNDQPQTENAVPEQGKPAVDKEEEVKEEEPAEEKSEEPAEELPEIVITASHSDVTFKAAGDSFRLTAKELPAAFKVTYASEDETIATVAEDGTVTAVGPGTTNVTMCVEQPGVASYEFSCIIRCSWSDGAASGVDLSAYFNSFMSSLGEGNTPAMAELNEELIDAYYTGLNEISRKQSVLQMAAMMQVACEFALVECENAADVETVKSIFQSRVDGQVNGGAWYPSIEEAWGNADIIVNGNFVALIVAGEQQENAVKAFNALF